MTDKSPNKQHHLIQGVPLPEIVLPRKLPNVAIKMLRTELVVGSCVGALEHSLEALNAVGVGLTPYVLSDAVLDRIVVRQDVIGESVVGVDLGVDLVGMVHDEAAHCLALGIGDDPRLDLIRGSVLDPGNSCFPDRSATRESLPLFAAHVATLPAEVCLIDFHRTLERGTIRTRPSLPDSMEHEPSSSLGHADIPVQLHAGDPFETGQLQVDGNGPLSQGDFGMRQGRSGPDREVFPAVGAPVGHGLPAGRLFGPGRSAVAAAPFLGPKDRLEPLCSRLFVEEHLNNLDDRETVSEVLSRSFMNSFASA